MCANVVTAPNGTCIVSDKPNYNTPCAMGPDTCGDGLICETNLCVIADGEVCNGAVSKDVRASLTCKANSTCKNALTGGNMTC